MTLNPVSLKEIKEQASFCEEVSRNISEIIPRIQKSCWEAGLTPEIQRYHHEMFPSVDADDIRRDATTLQTQADACLQYTQKMMRLALERPYKSPQLKQIISVLHGKIQGLRQQKARLTEVLASQEKQDVSMEKGNKRASPEVEEDRQSKRRRKEPDLEREVSSMEVDSDQDIESKLYEFERRIAEINSTQKYDSIEGRRLYRELMEYDFFTLMQNSCNYDEKTSALIDSVNELQFHFTHHYVSSKRIDSLTREIDQMGTPVESFSKLKNLKKAIDYVLDPSYYWEEESFPLRQKFESVKAYLETLPFGLQKEP